jgi:hypothetical protein
MKRTILTLGLLTGFAVCQVLGQTGGGAAGAGGTTGGAAAGGSGNAGGAAVGGAAGAGANVAVPPVREPLPPTFNSQTTPNQGTTLPGAGASAQGNGSVNAGNGGAGANANTSVNAAGTNAPGLSGTNQPLTPASGSDAATNRIYWTNRFNTNLMNTNGVSATNRFGLGPQDIAATEFDRRLIMRARATIIQRLGGTPAAWAPVTFNANNGAVTVAGAVPSVVIKQRVIAMLQTFPGVVSVNDQLQINASMDANGNTTAVGATTTGNVQAGPTGGRPVTRTTNREALMPTGRGASGTAGVTNSTPATTP